MQMLKPKIIERDKLYYGKFKYKLTFNLWYAHWTNYCRNMNDITAHINKRIADNDASMAFKNKPEYPNIELIDIDKISKLVDFREKYHPRNSTVTIAGIYAGFNNVTRVFTNDLAVMYESFDIGGQNYKLFEVKQIDVPRGVMMFKRDPKFKYRTYFKEKRVNQEWKTDFLDFLSSNPWIIPSPSLHNFLKTQSSAFSSVWLQSNHFIEYNEPSIRIVIDLFFDHEYLGKHYELQKQEDK